MNKEELEKQVLKDREEEFVEDKISTMKLDTGEEFVVFDLAEENKKKKDDSNEDNAEDWSQKTTLD